MRIILEARTFNKAVKKLIKATYPKVTGIKKIGKTVALLNSDKKVVGFWEPTFLTGSKLVINSWY